MKPTLFEGVGTALITPMHPDGSINYKMFKRLIEFQISGGANALIVCATTGEAPTLSPREHLKAIGYAVRCAAGRIPILAGTGSNDTRHAIQMSLAAKRLGVQGLLLVTPYYNKTSQTGLVQHFFSIADAVRLPIMVYQVPARTGLSILPHTYAQLGRHPWIVAAKDASGNLAAIAYAMSLCNDALAFYCGNDNEILPMLSLGAKGVVSVMANLHPALAGNICTTYAQGQLYQCRLAQLRCMELAEQLFADVNPMPIKAAMQLTGWNVGRCRAPLTEIAPSHRTRLRRALQALHFPIQKEVG